MHAGDGADATGASRSIADEILSLAHACGLDDAGIAPPFLPDEEEHLASWLEQGHAASMDWIARAADVRVDLRRRFPWARSVIVTTTRYWREPARDQDVGLMRHVSRFARGVDYHDLIPSRLEAFAARLATRFGGDETPRHHVYVDTGPVLERQMARAAGLGWLGKNGLLLQGKGGSYVFLGVIVSELELPFGHAEVGVDREQAPLAPGSCGSCTACQPACPTDAFVAPGVLDSRRCISYLTIEHRGAIERGLRRAMGEWLFGCDLCQSACPFNHGAPPSEDPAFAPAAAVRDLDLAGLLALDEDAFRARFHATPLWRPKREGLLRNALIVAANGGHRDCLPAARALLRDDAPVLREAASWCLAEFDDAGSAALLRQTLERETEDWVREKMAQDLIRLLSSAARAAA